MRKDALYSGILHVIVLIVLLVGIPFPQRQVEISEQPIIMEFTKIDTVSRAPVLSSENSKKKTEPKPPKKTPPPELQEEKIEKPEQPQKEPVKEKRQEKESPPPVKEKKPDLEPEPVPLPKKDEDVKKKKEPKKEVPPQKKPEEKKDLDKEKTKKEVKNDKALVDLQKKKTSPKPLAKAKPLTTSKSADDLIASLLDDAEDAGLDSAPAQMVGDEITATEIDAIRERIYKCWLVPPGAKDARNLVVDVHMSISKEGVVQKAEVLNKERMHEPNFEAAAESAQRAVLDPNCNPLPLSADKYDQWKELTLRFNPKDMY